jgi:predicted nucleotidyltransferase
VDKGVLETIERFKCAVEAAGIRLRGVVLFGSHAAGKPREHSDIDVAVISDDFEGLDVRQRLEILGLALARAKIMEPIEALAYTTEEYDSPERGTFLADEVKAKGVSLI